jgi:hypothetical protein
MKFKIQFPSHISHMTHLAAILDSEDMEPLHELGEFYCTELLVLTHLVMSGLERELRLHYRESQWEGGERWRRTGQSWPQLTC